MSDSEQLVRESLQRFAGGDGALNVRTRILGEVNAELRARRRDRRLTWLAVGTLVIALSGNWIVAQHETVRMSRWFPLQDDPNETFDEPAFAKPAYVDKSSIHKLQKYLAVAYQSSGILSQQAVTREIRDAQVSVWIHDISGT